MSKKSALDSNMTHCASASVAQDGSTGVVDFALGSLLVLLQYGFSPDDGPSRDLLGHILHRIKMKDTFTYPIFCHYVISVDFLEEFALLANSGWLFFATCSKAASSF